MSCASLGHCEKCGKPIDDHHEVAGIWIHMLDPYPEIPDDEEEEEVAA